ncbi:hypothetical protein [Inmirania thermothiophila]|nr:hypothetical protein [Inmirania thermothiophila]
MRRSDYGRPLDLRRGVVEMAHGGGADAGARSAWCGERRGPPWGDEA